jgi:hypothetical protein
MAGEPLFRGHLDSFGRTPRDRDWAGNEWRKFVRDEDRGITAERGVRGTNRWLRHKHVWRVHGFSRYLRLDSGRSNAFVATARALLEAGAPANTGWIEMIDFPNSRPVPETAIYAAAAYRAASGAHASAAGTRRRSER